MAQQSIPLTADARERFLLEIVARIPAERLAEIHFFPPLRQGQIETGVAVVAAIPETGDRHVVYSARYRWTRKGPDRGKWESEIVAEADAPLVTVEAVVQGVRERATETFEPTRLDGETLRLQIAEVERRWQTTP